MGGCDVEGEILTYNITEEPLNGSIFQDGSMITYTPDQDFNGEDSFKYTVSDSVEGDGSLTSSEGEVIIIVDPVNDLPVANDQSLSTNEDEVLTITIVGNDVDPDQLTFEITDNADHGSADLSIARFNS